MNLLLQLLVNGLVNGMLFAMLAVGFGLVWRTTRVFHVAYGGLFVATAYCFQGLTTNAGLPPALAVGVTLAVALAAGAAIEAGFYRPFYRRQASSEAVLIASLGLFVVMENVIAMYFGNETRTVTRPITPALPLGPVSLTPLQIAQCVIGGAAVSVLWLLVRRLRVFRALWAMGDQPELISVLGLPLFRLRTLAFATSTALVAIPASLITMDVGIKPQMGMSYFLIAVVAVLVGGINSYAGWVGGAVLLAMLQSLMVWQFSSRWVDLVTFGLLVLILVLRPQGLFERRVRMEET